MDPEERASASQSLLAVGEQLRDLWDVRSVRIILILLATALGFGGYLLLHARGAEVAATPEIVRTGSSTLSSPSPPSDSTSASASPGLVVVDVVGPVRRPGVVELPVGSRVSDAVAAAGGLSRGKTTINLARVLVDGEQIDVGAVGGAAAPVGSGSGSVGGGAPASGESTTRTKININTATITELEELPRVGPVTAQKIIDFRTTNGGFRTVDQLQEVPGIGDATFAGLSPLVTV